jgi:predicted ATP-grasp superfamily ATP-dependent carboligase
VHTLACRFFEGLALSGPVSLELKRDPAGSYWVIEPTVGRTDFWAGLCAANGVDLTLVEYAAVTGQPPPASTQRRTHLWVNGERDPGALFWLLRNTPRRLTTAKVQGVYLGLEDPGPVFTAMSRFLAEIPARISRRPLRTIRGSA